MRYSVLLAALALLAPVVPAATAAAAATAAVTVTVAAHGAVANDAVDDTAAFERAIAAVAAAGVGTVRAGSGSYLVRPDRLALPAAVTLAGSGTVLTAAGHGRTLLTMRGGSVLSGVTVEGADKAVVGVAVAAGATNVRLTSVTVRGIAAPHRPDQPGYAANRDQTPVGIMVSGDTDGVLLDRVTVDGVRGSTRVVGDFEGRYPLWPTFNQETAYHAHRDRATGATVYDDPAYAYSWRLVDSPVRAGATAYRSELRATDPQVTGSTRAEVARRAEPAREEHWYGFSIMLPRGGAEDWSTDTSAEAVAQWHNSPDPAEKDATISPPLALLTRNGAWELHRWWDERPVTNNSLMWNSGRHEERPLGSYEADKGRWTDWAFHVRWGWLPGHRPLLEVFKDRTLVYRSTGPNTTNDAVGTYFKMGVYKWDWWQRNPSQTTSRVIYHDEFRVDDATGSLDTVSPPTATQPAAARGVLVGADAGQRVPRNVTIRSSVVRNVGPKDDGDCVVLQAPSPDTQPDANLVVTGSTFTGCAGSAVTIRNHGATVTSNRIDNPFLGTNPFVLRAASQDLTDARAGVTVQASRVTVSGNTIGGAGSYQAGIDVGGRPLTGVVVTRNTVANGAGSRTATAAGIHLRTPVTGLTLQGNTVRTAATGVRCDAPPVTPAFAPNTVTGIATPYTGCLATPAARSAAVLRPSGGDDITVTTGDAGASPAEFRAARITATVDGRAAAVTWADGSTVRVRTPAGTPGARPVVVLARGGVAAAPVSPEGRYAATITAGAAGAVPLAGGATRAVRGAGFTGGTWALVGPVTVGLPRVETLAALAGRPAGVVITSDTTATVKLPPAPDTTGDGRGDAGTYTLALTPAGDAPYLPGPATVAYR